MPAGDDRGLDDGDGRDTEEKVEAGGRIPATDVEPSTAVAADASELGRDRSVQGGVDHHGGGAGGGDRPAGADGESGATADVAAIDQIPIPPLTVENVEIAAQAAVGILREERWAWSGPMPDPDTLRAYEEVLPGAAERILQMAEVASKGRHDIQSRLADEEIESSRQGRWMAFALALIAMSAAIAFFAAGVEVGGGFMLSLPVVLLVRSMLAR